MINKLIFTAHSLDDLARLDKKVAKRISDKLEWYIKQSDPLSFASKLKPPLENFWRFRFGDYRAIFEITKKGELRLLIILRIKHRKEVYE